MKFVKMHGCGNDYVYLDGYTEPGVARRIDEAGWAELVRRISDRHKGIGSDGVIVVCQPSTAARDAGAHARMRMFNSDGSESEMCGNGVRCVAKFAYDRLGVRANPMLVETGRGLLNIAYETAAGKVQSATVDMGEPILDAARVPVDLNQTTPGSSGGFALRGFDTAKDWMFVSMGNPHAVTWQLGDGDRRSTSGEQLVTEFGPRVETHAAFPNRTNMHIIRNKDRSHADVFTWERGAGMTQACGTGVCASVVAGVLNGQLDREVTVRVLGGELRIRWDEKTNHVFMTGPAEDICEGVWLGEATPAASVKQSLQPKLMTARLVLRLFTMNDAADVARLGGDRRVSSMTLTVPHPYSLSDAEGWLSKHPGFWLRDEQAVFAVCERMGHSVGTLIGAIGLSIERAHRRAELGYWIGVEHWGKGYATEASVAMIEFGFGLLDLDRIHASHFGTNPASGRVLLKAGLAYEGTAAKHLIKWGEPLDQVRYGLHRDIWKTVNRGEG